LEAAVTRTASKRSLLLLATVGIALTTTVGAGTTSAKAEQGHSLVSAARSVPWSWTPLVAVPFTEGLVQVPRSRYAFDNAQGRLVRIDLADGRLLNGSVIASDDVVFTVGSSVVVLSAPVESSKHQYLPQSLRLVNQSTATLGRPVKIPSREDWGLLAVTPGPSSHGVWLAADQVANAVELVDVRTGASLRLMRFATPVLALSPSPDGSVIYLVRYDHLSCPGTLTLDELSEASSRVLAHACIGGVSFTLTAAQGGIWASVRTGMQGYDALFRSDGLSRVVPIGSSGNGSEEVGPPTLNGQTDGGISVRAFGDSVWLGSTYGLSCDAPTTGRFIAGTTFAKGNTLADGRRVFADWNDRIFAEGQRMSRVP